MNIVPGKYDAKKLRYGKIAICTDADSDGSHIGLLIMANLYKFAPDFIREGRLYWLRTPLWVNTVNGKEYYYFTDEELAPVRSKLKGSLDRNKGLGSLDVETARRSMFTEEFQRMDRIKASEESLELLSQLMGADIEPRREYVFNNIDFSTIRE
jgi:topoisomerase-4 subunit B